MHRVSGCDNLVANRVRPPWVRAGLNSNNKGSLCRDKGHPAPTEAEGRVSPLQTKGAWSSQDQGEARKDHLILDV